MSQQISGDVKSFLIEYGWAFLIILAMVGALAYFGILSSQEETTKVNTTNVTILKIDYQNKFLCVEWDGWIRVEQLPLDCYDFQNNKFVCAWKIGETDGTLQVQSVSGEIKEYNCTRGVNTVRIS